MSKKLKAIVLAGLVAFSVPVLMSMRTEKKVCISHNGHNICIAEPAAMAHLREHPTDKDLGPCR